MTLHVEPRPSKVGHLPAGGRNFPYTHAAASTPASNQRSIITKPLLASPWAAAVRMGQRTGPDTSRQLLDDMGRYRTTRRRTTIVSIPVASRLAAVRMSPSASGSAQIVERDTLPA